MCEASQSPASSLHSWKYIRLSTSPKDYQVKVYPLPPCLVEVARPHSDLIHGPLGQLTLLCRPDNSGLLQLFNRNDHTHKRSSMATPTLVDQCLNERTKPSKAVSTVKCMYTYMQVRIVQ